MLALEVAHEAQLACCNGAIVDVYHENCSWDRVCVSASGYGNATCKSSSTTLGHHIQAHRPGR